MFTVDEQQRDAFVQDKGVFFEWLLNGNRDNAPKKTLKKLGTTADEYCQQYESYVWFKMGKLMWVRHQTVHDEHIRYLKNKIIKPYDMVIRDFYDQVIEMYSFLYYLQQPSMNNQAWYQAKWHMFNGLPRSMQDKLDQKDEDYHMGSNETFLGYLYHLEIEDRQERAEKQRLKESFEKKGNLKAAEAVETGRIPKKDKKHQSDASEKGSSKKAKKGKYCDWCTDHGKEDRFVHSHNEADCNFKKAPLRKPT
jgi:hypothetical protein